MKKIFSIVITLCLVLCVIGLAACEGQGDIPAGKYEFNNITFGNFYIDASDTENTIKEKLLIEYPDYDWDALWFNVPKIDLEARNLLEIIEDGYSFKVNGSRMTAKIGTASINNEKCRVIGTKLEIRRFFAHNEFGFRWIGTEYDYADETIYRDFYFGLIDGINYRVNYRVNYKR